MEPSAVAITRPIPLHTVGELKDWTKRHLWSKTTLNTGGMGGARVNSPHL